MRYQWNILTVFVSLILLMSISGCSSQDTLEQDQLSDESNIDLETYREYFTSEIEFEEFKLNLENSKPLYPDPDDYKRYVERELFNVTLPLTVEYTFDNITIVAIRPKGILVGNAEGKIDIKLDNETVYTIESTFLPGYWFTGEQPHIKPEAGLFYGLDKKQYLFLKYFSSGHQYQYPSKCYLFRLEDNKAIVACMLHEKTANVLLAGDRFHISSDFFNIDEYFKPAYHPGGELHDAEFLDAKKYELYDFDNDGYKEILYYNGITYNGKTILCYLVSMLQINEQGDLQPLWTYPADFFEHLILVKIDYDGITMDELKANVEEFLPDYLDMKEFDTKLTSLIENGIIYLDDSGLYRLKSR